VFKNYKTAITFLIKLLIGVMSFWIIYNRLSHIPELKEQCLQWLGEPTMYVVFIFVLCLMPINWGIESYKWKLITTQIEPITYITSVKAVLTGICIGNIAPGRAMEFLAKIYYFKPHNRPSVTILHFINGMFQMLITLSAGLIAIAYKLNESSQTTGMIYVALTIGVCMVLFFCWAIFNASYIQRKLQFIKWFKDIGNADHLRFTKKIIFTLISLSIVRYAVFTTQFYIIYHALSPQSLPFQVFLSIAAYFTITSIIPMISFIEPAIRAAIAILVFNSATDNEATVVLASILVWIVNVVVPSAIGYVIILKEKINFKTERAH
jgi:hypothetical protein